MSMGYDEDDPRRETVLEGLRSGQWKLQPGQRANVHDFKLGRVMPSRFGLGSKTR